MAENSVSVARYKALYEEDTIDSKINTLEEGTITGDMEMRILDMPIKRGKLSGEFRGDTFICQLYLYPRWV
jgi:hypothetical protein